MDSDLERRAARERAFHDVRLAGGDGTRRSSAFHEVAQSSKLRFAEWVDRIPTGAKVLELGCGPDSVAWQLLARGVDATGIDISQSSIDRAQAEASARGFDPQQFMVGNAEQLEMEAGSFDAVIGSSILHHLQLSTALPGIARVLTPNGRVLFYEPLGRNPAINLYRRLTPSERTVDEHPLRGGDLGVICHHFEEVEFEYYHLTSLASLPLIGTGFFSPIYTKLELIDRWLFERVPALRSHAWVFLIAARGKHV